MDTIFLYALDVSALNADSAVWAAFVSEDRRARMEALKNIEDRRRSLGAELALHAALSLHVDGYAPPARLPAPAGRQAGFAGRAGLAHQPRPRRELGRVRPAPRAGGRGYRAQGPSLGYPRAHTRSRVGELSQAHRRRAFRRLSHPLRAGDGDLPPRGARGLPRPRRGGRLPALRRHGRARRAADRGRPAAAPLKRPPSNRSRRRGSANAPFRGAAKLL